jgi:superfamily II DNA or RNA helicase
LGRFALATIPVTPLEKIELFIKLFRCRENVHPKRWENNKNGKQGYSPVCANEWVKPICQKPTIKCAECSHQKFLPLDQHAVEAHLKGLSTIGTYAIREDDSCIFLACDFDESDWQGDSAAYKQAARELGIDVAIEKSRSGRGAHAWIFFEETIPARIARSLGTLILAKCSELNIRLSLDSYDRFFPSQDYLPRGGFGNLIALPLQKTPREMGNSCFLDDKFQPFENQWGFLSHVRCLSLKEVREILDKFIPKINLASRQDSFDDISWITDQAILDKTTSDRIEYSLDGAQVEISFGPMLSIPLAGLPGKVVAKLKKTSSFPNPEFYKKQRMRMPTYPERRFIFSGEMRPEEIILPRGVLDEVVKILTIAGAKVVIRDERIARRKIKVTFSGELTDIQKLAVKAWKSTDLGVLVAPPGAGKTVMGCAVIAERKVSTLILVHRSQIFDQWKAQIEKFLGIPAKEIGTLSGTKKKITGRVDLAMLQSLKNFEEFSEIAQMYSQIIIDECHHIPASSFEGVLKQLPARYVLGLTATPYRKDGLEKILFQQCGPIRHEIKSADGGVLSKSVKIFETGFRTPDDVGPRPPYHVLIHLLTNDPGRNSKIAKLAVDSILDKRFPLLISDRKEHLDVLAKLIDTEFSATGTGETLEIVRLDGDLTGKQRRAAIEQIHTIRAEGKALLLMATASLIGEGFDLPALDTLLLATPLSFEGRMVQYAGRLHRLVEGKTEVRIIDFVDSFSAMLLKMYRNRVKAYQNMGYTIHEPTGGYASLRSRTQSTAPTGFL